MPSTERPSASTRLGKGWRTPVRLPRREFRDAAELVVPSHAVVDYVRRMASLTTNGDFEALVLWFELALRRARAGPPRAGQSARGPITVKLQQLVASTGVPRETARRKLELLVTLGRVDRVDKGWAVRATDAKTLARVVTGRDRALLLHILAALEANSRGRRSW